MFNSTTANIDVGLKTFMQTVYRNMFLGLVLSGAVAFLCSNNGYLHQLFFHMTPKGVGLTIAGWGAILAPLGMMLVAMFSNPFSWSVQGTTLFFYILTAFEGVGLYAAVTPYSTASISTALMATAGAFAFLSLVGYTTNRDLSGVGSFCIMGLWGLIIYPLVAMLFHLPYPTVMMGVIGVMVFAGLTAYDTQKLKTGYMSGDNSQQMAIWGALTLYLDFINLFLYMLQIMGDRDKK